MWIMPEFVIQGGNRLSGDIAVSGGKNAVLPIMAASVMAGSPCTCLLTLWSQGDV